MNSCLILIAGTRNLGEKAEHTPGRNIGKESKPARRNGDPARTSGCQYGSKRTELLFNLWKTH